MMALAAGSRKPKPPWRTGCVANAQLKRGKVCCLVSVVRKYLVMCVSLIVKVVHVVVREMCW